MSFGTSGWVLIVSKSPCFIAVPQQGTQNVEFNNLVYHITKHIKSACKGTKKGEYFVTLYQIINKS